MLMSPKFNSMSDAGVVEFTRQGVAKSVILPEDLKKRIGYDINADFDNNVVVFSEGEEVYMLVDRFAILYGANAEVELNLFFIDGGAVVELKHGKVILEGENGEVYAVDESGDITYPSEYALSKAKWVTIEDLRSTLSSMVTVHYGTSSSQTVLYVDNLVFSLYLQYIGSGKPENGGILTTRVLDYYEDLALGQVEFYNFHDETLYDEDDGHIDIGDLTLEEDDYEDDEDIDIEYDDDDTDDDMDDEDDVSEEEVSFMS